MQVSSQVFLTLRVNTCEIPRKDRVYYSHFREPDPKRIIILLVHEGAESSSLMLMCYLVPHTTVSGGFHSLFF